MGRARDEVHIDVVAGDGGDGFRSFRREKYIPRGGPDGGDGGDGGDVILVASSSLQDLRDLTRRRRYPAAPGQKGGKSKSTGARGASLSLPVPLGTLVYMRETGEKLADLTAEGQEFMVARGGKGGIGNAHFRTSIVRAPRRTTPGAAGDRRRLRLELRMLADVGLCGLPNAGKSSLLRALSSARPRVGDYPFTTLIPQIGVVADFDNSIQIADVPGLVENAAEGRGLGHRFLRHLMRTRLLLHVVDAGSADFTGIAEQIRVIEAELESFDESLINRPRWLVLNKVDLWSDAAHQEFSARVGALGGADQPLYALSAQTGAGCEALQADLKTFFADKVRERSA